MVKEDLNMDNDQESDPFLPKSKVKTVKYIKLLINKTDIYYITSDKLYFKISLINCKYLQNLTFECISVSLTIFNVHS